MLGGGKGLVRNTTWGFYRALDLVFDARREYLYGDRRRAFRLLGMALHYVHDALIPQWPHEALERSIGKENLDISLVRESLKDFKPSLKLIRDSLLQQAPLEEPREIVSKALELTALLLNAVIWEPPETFKNLVSHCATIRINVLGEHRTALSFLSLGIPFGLLATLLSLGLMVFSPAIGAITLAASLSMAIVLYTLHERMNARIMAEIARRDSRCLQLSEEVIELMWYP
ncbi:MAG: hypothetical protein ABWK00_05095 [Desulfurococcaceae archaeon]